MITESDFERVNSDIYGNPRYAIHFTCFQPVYSENMNLNSAYIQAVKFCNKYGGRKYHNKSYGGGIVFQSYSLTDLCKTLNKALKDVKP